jgi:hypothetical protein
VDLQQVRDLIDQREHTATATAHRLRDQINALTEQLAAVETELADLATTRHTLTALAGDPEPAIPATGPDPGEATSEVTQGAAETGEPVGPSPTYTQILATFTSTDAMRAKDICLTLGLEPIPKNTEGVRAKLKRLVTRGALREDRPGLFTLATEPEHDQHH